MIRTAKISDSSWRELLAALHPADRHLTYNDGEPAIVVRVGMKGQVVQIVRGKGITNGI